ncbi:MAG: hypothetical protein ACFFA0_02910 [Promethearchaeota archaeon]
MSIFDFFKPEKSKKKLEELKILLQLNPQHFKEVKRIKLKKGSAPAY